MNPIAESESQLGRPAAGPEAHGRLGYVWAISLVAALGGLLFGYDWVVISGAAIGLASTLSPMYIAEVAPAQVRGKLVSINQLTIVIVGLANLTFTFVAIQTVEKLGRRFLMLAGCVGLALIYALLGGSYFFKLQGVTLVILVVAAIGCYACTLAPMTWVVLSEIFPNRIRGAAMSIAVFALWTGCFTLTYTFPLLNARLGSAGTFWLYAAIGAGGFVFCRARLPETKGKTWEQIERELVD